MKNELLNLLNNYLQIFPKEKERQLNLLDFLNKTEDRDIIDWNNFEGHIVAGGFIYAKKENKFLVLYHKELKMYLYPGGHVEYEDKTILDAAKREIKEETGLSNLEQLKIDEDNLIPIDIDTHKIPFNNKRNLPEHYHFDFRYIFVIDKIGNIKIDTEESDNYQWIDLSELKKDPNYEKVSKKIETLLKEEKKH